MEKFNKHVYLFRAPGEGAGCLLYWKIGLFAKVQLQVLCSSVLTFEFHMWSLQLKICLSLDTKKPESLAVERGVYSCMLKPHVWFSVQGDRWRQWDGTCSSKAQVRAVCQWYAASAYIFMDHGLVLGLGLALQPEKVSKKKKKSEAIPPAPSQEGTSQSQQLSCNS